MQFIYEHFNSWISVILMMIGFYAVLKNNLFKKIIGLGIFQVSVLLFYISLSYRSDGSLPIISKEIVIYNDPLPHVLMLTAIVVGVSVMAVGLAILSKINSEYGTIEEDEIIKLDKDFNLKERDTDNGNDSGVTKC